MVYDWVREKPSDRAFLCTPIVCDILQAYIDRHPEDGLQASIHLQDITELHNPKFFDVFYLRSIYLPHFTIGSSEDDAYPYGSDFLVDAQVASFRANQKAILAERPAMETKHYHPPVFPPESDFILFLSRENSRRRISAEEKVVESIRRWGRGRGLGLVEMPHNCEWTRRQQVSANVPTLLISTSIPIPTSTSNPLPTC